MLAGAPLFASQPTLAANPAATRQLRLGMPQLAFSGLSESWLLMDCGHQHWALLATRLGRPVEDLADSLGNPIYASFVSHHVSGALHEYPAGTPVQITSSLHQLSGKRFCSVHILEGPDNRQVRVEMISIFLRRGRPNCNETLVSCGASFAGLPAGKPVLNLEHLDRLIRGGSWSVHRGFQNAAPEIALGELIYSPVPSTDFNAAQLLYFARYHEVVDRAEWELLTERDPRNATTERQVHYFANIDPGDRVVARLVSHHSTAPGRFAHHFRLLRQSDGRLMAEMFTWKSASPEQEDLRS